MADAERLRLRRLDGSDYHLTRRQFEAAASEYAKVPHGDPQGSPVKTYIDPSLKVGDIKVCGQPIRTLPNSVKEKIVDKLKEDIPTSESFERFCG